MRSTGSNRHRAPPAGRGCCARAPWRAAVHRLDVLRCGCPARSRRARRVVDHHRDRRVAEPELARQRRFRHAGHADHVGAVALQPVDLGGGLEPRPLRGGIDAAVDDCLAAAAAASSSRWRSASQYGLREIDVHARRCRAPSKNVDCAPVRVVDDLVRHHQRAGRRARRGCRPPRPPTRRPSPSGHAAPTGWRGSSPACGGMVWPSPWRARNTTSRPAIWPKVSAPGRLAVRRAHHLALRHLEVGKLGQAAAADDR